MIGIGKVINYLLLQEPAISAKVGDRLYPIVAPDDTNYPFIVYKRMNINAKYSKDGCFANVDTVKINVISKEYPESVELMQAVRDVLERFKGIVSGITVRSAYVESASEDFGEDGYIQELNFLIETN